MTKWNKYIDVYLLKTQPNNAQLDKLHALPQTIAPFYVVFTQ